MDDAVEVSTESDFVETISIEDHLQDGGTTGDDCEPSAKKRRVQVYKSLYSKKWKCILPSKKGDNNVFCELCQTDLSIGSGGANDITRHVKSKKHQEIEQIRTSKSNTSITSFFSSGKQLGLNEDGEHSVAVTRAEVTMCELLAHHNLPIATADTFSSGFKNMFPDSKIAAGMKCGRRKATVLIKTLGKDQQEVLSSRLQKSAFTLSTDGSNDDKSKQFPLVVRSIDLCTGLVNSELFVLPECSGPATGENIFKLLDSELKARNIEWKNCLSLGCDNAAVMTGKYKGVIAYIRKQHPEVHMAGCCLHLVHIAAHKGAQCLPDVADVLQDVYYFFQKSDKRKQEFSSMQVLFDVEQKRMLKHVCTRWLSIGRCLERLLQNWSPLTAYFKNEKKVQDSKKPSTSGKGKNDGVQDKPIPYAHQKVDNILKFIQSPTNKLYVLFLNYTVKLFDPVLIGLQSDEPKIHLLKRSLLKLIQTVLCRFVKPSALNNGRLEDVDFKSKYNLKEDKDLVIGEECEKYIADATSGLRECRLKDFYSDVKEYFQAVTTYLLTNLPLREPLLTHAQVADASLQQSSCKKDLDFFLNRFPALRPEGCTVDAVVEQFTLYQCTDISSCTTSQRMDEVWLKIGNLKDESGEPFLCELSIVMRGILTIPHSNAHCERIFSTVRKNRTEQRASMADDTLEALLLLKSKPGHPLDSQRQHPKDKIVKWKSASYKSLHQ